MSTEDKAALAKGAEAIRKAAKKKPVKAEEVKPLDLLSKSWSPSKRPVQEIIAERIKMAADGMGLIVAKDTPLDEHIPMLHYYAAFGDHIGFYMGDLIIAGQEQHGAKYEAAMAITGLALSTLKGYVTTAKAVPLAMRQKALDFTAHREVARLKSPEKKIKILTDAAAKAKAGSKPTTKEVRNAVVKAEPPTKSKTSGKAAGGKKSKPAKKKDAPPPYEYTKEERAEFDTLLATLGDLDDRLGSKSGKDFLSATVKTDNKLKRQLLARAGNIKSFINQLEKYTGQF